MNNDNKNCFDNSRLLFNDVRFVINISIYQIKLKLFFFVFNSITLRKSCSIFIYIRQNQSFEH